MAPYHFTHEYLQTEGAVINDPKEGWSQSYLWFQRAILNDYFDLSKTIRLSQKQPPVLGIALL